MSSAKDIQIAPVSAKDATALVKRVHYSGKVVQNSQLHLGAFLNGRLEGVMSFGPSMDKRKIQGLVKDTAWNGFIELNRMAFSENLPRNSESRALSVAFRIFRKQYPHIEWIISFADGCQCGDGTIYRASGFDLCGIRPNDQIIEFPGGERETRLNLTSARCGGARTPNVLRLMKKYNIPMTSKATLKPFFDAGAKPVPGYMLRYIYFLNPAARERLTVSILPFSRIDELGARMAKGKRLNALEAGDEGDHPHSGGATPTPTLHISPTPDNRIEEA